MSMKSIKGNLKQNLYNSLNKKIIVFLICLLLFGSVIFLTTQVYFELDKNLKTHNTNAPDLIDQRMSSIF